MVKYLLYTHRQEVIKCGLLIKYRTITIATELFESPDYGVNISPVFNTTVTVFEFKSISFATKHWCTFLLTSIMVLFMIQEVFYLPNYTRINKIKLYHFRLYSMFVKETSSLGKLGDLYYKGHCYWTETPPTQSIQLYLFLHFVCSGINKIKIFKSLLFYRR